MSALVHRHLAEVTIDLTATYPPLTVYDLSCDFHPVVTYSLSFDCGGAHTTLGPLTESFTRVRPSPRHIWIEEPGLTSYTWTFNMATFAQVSAAFARMFIM